MVRGAPPRRPVVPPPRGARRVDDVAAPKPAGARKLMIAADETYTVMGMRGTGKTTIFRYLADLQLKATKVVVWDPLAQYPSAIAYRPRSLDRDELGTLSAALWASAPCRLMVEEAEQVLEQGRPLPDGFKQFALMGRNVGLSWAMNVRSPQRLTKTILDESDHLLIFKLGGRALTYTKDYLGGGEARRLGAMRKWPKKPSEGGGRYFWYHDGALEEMPPLDVVPDTTPQTSQSIQPDGR